MSSTLVAVAHGVCRFSDGRELSLPAGWAPPVSLPMGDQTCWVLRRQGARDCLVLREGLPFDTVAAEFGVNPATGPAPPPTPPDAAC